MEGRAIARPNSTLQVVVVRQDVPSMEGRAIARPNKRNSPPKCIRASTFNGGPSNRSAKPVTVDAATVAELLLQWRAEQSLGQTSPPKSVGGDWNLLQWRAEQSLGQTCGPRRRRPCLWQPFNGGPSNRSAKRRVRPELDRWSPPPFNGGPSNRSAKPTPRNGPTPRNASFNGGPSNRSAKHAPTHHPPPHRPTPFNGGPSNRSAKPRPRMRASCRSMTFNGGPSNRSAKPRHQRPGADLR